MYPLSVRCPGCQAEFEADTVNGVTVAVCAACDGVWLAAGDLDRLAGEELEGQFHSWMGEPTECRHCQTPLGFGGTCVRCGKAPTLTCPRGHGVMNATLVEIHDKEFEIDQCPSCRGIWIDGHEREHLATPDVAERRRNAIILAPRPHSSSGTRSSSVVNLLNSPVSPLQYLVNNDPLYFVGRREPFQLVVFVIFALGALAALYKFVGPMLGSF